MPNPSFDRARRFGRRTVGFPLAVYLSGIAAAAVLTLLVLLVPILAELLAERGTLNKVPTADRAMLRQLAGEPDSADAQSTTYEHRGLLPTVWRLRNSWLGPSYAALYSSCRFVRANHSCLLFVICLAGALIAIAAVTLIWLETSVNKFALQTASALRWQIYDQAHRLGVGDLFLGQRWVSRELFIAEIKSIRRGLVAWWRVVPHAAAFFTIMLILALSVDFWLTLATVLLVALIWWMFSEIRHRMRHKENCLADAAERFLAPALEYLEQNRLIANLATDLSPERRHFDDTLQRHDYAALARETTSAIVKPLMAIFAMLGFCFVLLLAGYNVLGEPPRVSMAEAVLLGTALCAAAYPLYLLERLLESLPTAEQAAAHVFVYLDREPRVGQLPHATPLEPVWRQITFQKVTLADMEGNLLLDSATFGLALNSQTVIFSSDEHTPRAVAALLARFCDPAAGRVLFDRQDLAHVTLPSVRQQVAVVLADHLLINGTLRENIVGADQQVSAAEDAKIIDALKQTHAYEFVQAMPEGLETPLGSLGMTLPVGQAIRLGLARALLQSPAVLIVEEPRDDLDQTTAERVASALEIAAAHRTLVILARRLATLRAAQRILFFHEGRLLADGTHQDLLHSSEIYRHLNYVRFNEFRDSVK